MSLTMTKKVSECQAETVQFMPLEKVSVWSLFYLLKIYFLVCTIDTPVFSFKYTPSSALSWIAVFTVERVIIFVLHHHDWQPSISDILCVQELKMYLLLHVMNKTSYQDFSSQLLFHLKKNETKLRSFW